MSAFGPGRAESGWAAFVGSNAKAAILDWAEMGRNCWRLMRAVSGLAASGSERPEETIVGV